MTLRKKTLLIIGATLVGLVVVLYVTSSTILLNGFAKLEEQSTRQNVERAVDALFDGLSTLNRTAGDWATWDDTYAFIKDANDGYVRSNLGNETFRNLKLNLMLFVNSSGQIVYDKAFDLQNEKEIPVPRSLQEYLSANDLLLRHSNTESTITGIVLLPEASMLVASRPILTSERRGPIRGTLIFGRYLDTAEIERLVRLTHLSLTVHQFDAAQMPPDFQGVRSSLSETAPILVRPLSTESIAGYALLKDIYGKPGLLLRVDSPRVIYQQGQASTRYLLLSLLVLGLVFGVLTLWLLEKLVLFHLARLSAGVSSIGASGDLSARVAMTGRDELSSLADAINGMLARLEHSQYERRESEERYRAVVEQVSEGILMVDADTKRLLEANPAFQNLLGYAAAEIPGLTLYDIVAHDRESIDNNARRVLTQGHHFIGERRFRCKDGSLVDVEVSVNLISHGGREVLCAVVRDITGRKRAEEVLRRRADELAALYATSLDITAPHDLPVLLRTIVERAARLLNAPSGGLYLCDPERQEARCVVSYNIKRDYVGTVLKYGEGAAGLVAQTGKPLLIDDYRTWPGRAAVFEEDQPFTTVLSAPMIWQGQVTGVIHVHHDVEIRRFTQADLELLTLFANQAAIAVENTRLLEKTQKQARQVQQLMDTVPEGVLLLDAERRIRLANPAAREYLAVLADAGLGEVLTALGQRPIEELVQPPVRGSHHEVIAEGRPRRVFEVAAQPMEVGPEAGGWVLVLRDVTEQWEFQKRSQQQERLAAVGHLAAGIAHDFNNILTSIIGFAELLQMRPDIPNPARNQLGVIARQGQRAAQLIHQILDFSRQSIVQRQPLDLAPFLMEAVRFLERTIPESVHVVWEIELGEYVVNADPAQLQQVLTNLAVNARDVMPEGGELRFRLTSFTLEAGGRPPCLDMPPGDWVVLSVSDTGAGMSPEVLARIFEPFFTTKGPGRGTGLGLAQVYGIVQQHGGYIDVQSQVGQGTTFTIYLPALAVRREVPREQAPEEIVRGQGEMILLVEDEPAVLEVSKAMLQNLGYQVLTATTGQAALAVYDGHREEIALVLADMVMPGMGGVELFYTLRERNPGVKMVVMTGYPLGREAKELLSQGIVDWIQKPMNLAELAQVVRRGKS